MTEKFKDLELTIREDLDPGVRGFRFFAQGPLHDGFGHSFAEVQFGCEDFVYCSKQLVSGLFFHDVTGSAGAKRALAENQLIVLRKDEHLYLGMLDPHCFNETKKAAPLHSQV